jgi:two-component system sensor histidine kinase BaeS
VTDVDRLAVLAHELRSPIAALMAIEETVRAAGAGISAAELRRMLQLAVAAGRDMERLLADPELFSVERQPVDLAVLLEGLRGERVEVDVAAGLVVSADAGRLRQALANLVANGLRHADRVTVTAGAREGETWIAVADDGPGVASGLDPFAAGVSGVGSTGLGLYVARAVAEAHGGRLELTSAPGEGATFTLALPHDVGARD